MSEILHHFADRIAEVLETLGLGRIDGEPGAPFDARLHEAARTAGLNIVNVAGQSAEWRVGGRLSRAPPGSLSRGGHRQ